ncbi:twin-arginine translocase TatA/TatE family subunit [Actinomycetaceae bacterium MB13-C1-2]|nr:twin-arginine translocase TatA/TatE family subunit [Actinomycetaceae bacterium MB13-C1-2]
MKPSHILVFVLVLVIIFGASKLPDVAKYLGQSAKVLKKEIRELQDEDESKSSGTSDRSDGSSTLPGTTGPSATPDPVPRQAPAVRHSSEQPTPSVTPAEGRPGANEEGSSPAPAPDAVSESATGLSRSDSLESHSRNDDAETDASDGELTAS